MKSHIVYTCLPSGQQAGVRCLLFVMFWVKSGFFSRASKTTRRRTQADFKAAYASDGAMRTDDDETNFKGEV